MNRRTFLSLTGLTALACAAPAAMANTDSASDTAPRSKKHAPNIIFVLADDMSPYEFGCYGQTKIKTPTVDRMAREGLRATAAYTTCPLCAPSRCGFITGRHMGHAQIRNNRKYNKEGQFPLKPGTETVAHSLRQAGYVTGCFGKWGLGAPSTEGRPLRQGFDRFFGYNCQAHAHDYYPTYLWDNETRVPIDNPPHGRAARGKTYSAEVIRDKALEFIRSNAGKPIFLFYASTLPHFPVNPPEEDMKAYRFPEAGGGKRGGKLRAGYAAMVSRLDNDLARIIDTLKATGEYDNSLIIFSADNGTSSKGGNDMAFFGATGPLRGSKGTLYEGGVREPFTAVWPGKIKPGTVTDTPFWFADLFPTFCDIAGAPAPKETDGCSLKSLFLGEAPGFDTDRPFYWEFAGRQAVRKGHWKWHRNAKTGKTELYNLDNDPGETKDLAKRYPRRAAEGECLMDAAHTPNPDFPLLPSEKNAPAKDKGTSCR